MIPKRLKVRGWGFVMTGRGEALELSFKAVQETKGRAGERGKTHRFDVVMQMDRWDIGNIVEQIARMQIRDRQRIESELERLTDEIAPLADGIAPRRWGIHEKDR